MSTTDLSNLFRLDGKVALVTGGGRGLGLALARALGRQGATVAITGRTAESLAQAAHDLGAEGITVLHRAADVSRETDVTALAAWLEGETGHVDILVNNAGINPHYEPAAQTSTEHWQRIIDINLTGVFLCCREMGRGMLARGSGNIINISSVAGHLGLERTIAYCAAKGGVELITKALAVEWAKKGIRVNCIAPAYFETELTAGVRNHPRLAEKMLGRTPLGRFGRPDELAGAVVYLASAASDYVTGHTIVVDGGWMAG